MVTTRGRTTLMVVVGACVLTYLMLSPAQRLDAWSAMGVPVIRHTFADLRHVTASWDCLRRGLDVLQENPCDFAGRQLNYPRVWELPAILGLGEEATEPLGCALALVFLASVIAIVGQVTLLEALVVFAALASPPMLLAIERGNVDVGLFALCVASIMAITTSGVRKRGRERLAVFGLLLSGFLKLYPIVALAALAPRLRGSLIALAVFVLYSLVSLPDLAQISRITDRPTGWGYGTIPVAYRAHALVLRLTGVDLGGIDRLALVVTAGLVAGVLMLLLRAEARRLAETTLDGVPRTAFMAGSAIFLATYLIGGNWAYRLIFLLLLLPQAFQWARADSTRKTGLVLVATVLSVVWSYRFVPRGEHVSQILTVPMFMALGALLVSIFLMSWLQAGWPGSEMITKRFWGIEKSGKAQRKTTPIACSQNPPR